ncbi:hypothetical protein A5714_13370 [Mycobacterium sp. E2462]|nr:hypothetical protein A5714_13370 [Mycobacterium sp. E2462]
MAATTPSATPTSVRSKVLVICWARLLPYTGCCSGELGESANRGASATPTTTRATPRVATSPHSAATGRAEAWASRARTHSDSAAVTRSNPASTTLS